MSETIENINLGFSTADAIFPTIEYKSGYLNIYFQDWQEKNVHLYGHDTLAFRWKEAEYCIDDQERNDSVYIVHNSKWLKLHQDQGITWSGTDFIHYKLNFNACGVLEIICANIEVKIDETNKHTM